MIKLKKMDEGDYQLYLGVNTNEDWPDAFIAYDLMLKPSNDSGVCILDTKGLWLIFDHDYELISTYYLRCNLDLASATLKKLDKSLYHEYLITLGFKLI